MVEFLYRNINSVDVDEEAIIEYVKANHMPEDVFPESELAEWAESNGFVRMEGR